MAELADEELGSIVPVKVVKQDETNIQQKVGYYTDERGYKRWGIIPNQNIQIKVTSEFPSKGPRSSDPRQWGAG